MRHRVLRRDFLHAMGAAALVSSVPTVASQPQPKVSRMPSENKDTPKICLGLWGTVDEPAMRRLKQIGVD